MSNTTLEWIDLASLGSEVRQPVLNQVERLIQNHPDANIDHDPYWLSAKSGNDKSSKLFVCVTPDNTVAGYAPFFIHPSALLIRPLNSFKRHILHMGLESKKRRVLDCSPASSCDRWQRYAISPWCASALSSR